MRRDFKPNVKALQNLMDMGFSEEDTRDALRITGNNYSAAVSSVFFFCIFKEREKLHCLH
jgi:uncharacterized UBP type Zn finger protein